MSSSQILGAAAGAVVGFYTGNFQAGMLTYSVVAGVGTYLSQPDLASQMNGVGEYVNDVGLRATAGYSATPSGDLRDYDVARTDTSL
jgi:hypothetical protein